jgi:hypothetical protein
VTPEDYEELRAISARLSDLRSTAVLSPLHGRAVSRLRGGELKLFPRATAISHRDWDLNEPGVRDFDLIVAANVFMYSGRPREWFDNVLARCAYFLLLDLVRRKRAPDQELGDDGDAMRYATSGRGSRALSISRRSTTVCSAGVRSTVEPTITTIPRCTLWRSCEVLVGPPSQRSTAMWPKSLVFLKEDQCQLINDDQLV